MQAYIPIVVYRLPGDEKWTAEALGLEGAVSDGESQAEAKANLVLVLPTYISMLDSEDPLQAAQLEYVARLTEPPEGVDWIVSSTVPEMQLKEPGAAFEHSLSEEQVIEEHDKRLKELELQVEALKALATLLRGMMPAHRRIKKVPGVVGGDACIVRTRIPVWVLENYRRLGWNEARILSNFPSLYASDLVDAWDYVEEHEDEIEQAIRSHEEA